MMSGSKVKYHLGKLPLPEPPENYLPLQRERHLIASLSLDEASVSQLGKLPNINTSTNDARNSPSGMWTMMVSSVVRAILSVRLA